MKKSKFVNAIVMIALLSAFFGAGGVKPALADTAYLDDVAGIAAYAQVTPGLTFLDDAKGVCTTDDAGGPILEVDSAEYFICSVAVAGYAGVYAPHVFVYAHIETDELGAITFADGYIMAYYLEDEPAAKMLDVIAQPLDTLLTYPTLLEQAVGTVGVAVGIDPAVTPIDVSLYDFSNPLATDMLFVAEDKAEDLGVLGDDNAWFTLQMPASGEFYEFSYAFYQNYMPAFSLDGVNFVLANADYMGGAPFGTIYGDLASTALVAEGLYLFEVDTISYADAGYGALLITYSGVTDAFAIDSADWVEEFDLVAPSADLTALFTFDFAPADFAKLAPVEPATELLAPLTLSWAASAGATSYEYCIDESGDIFCDTSWISTGVNTSVTLTDLPYNAVYYWQVRAVNSYTTTDADAGVWWSFATKTGPPDTFGKLSPTDGTVSVPTSPILDWEDTPGTEYYEYCVVTDLEACEVDGDGWVDTGLVSQAVVSLYDNDEFSWQVRAVNSAGATYADDGFWSFSTVTSVSKVSPTDLATGINPRATLSWEAMDGADSYQYCVDTTDNDACSRWVSAGNVLEVTVRGLKYSTTYYWQVRAVTALGTTEADAGDWWTFTTRDRNAPPMYPPVFGKISPEDGESGQVYENLVLEWDDVAKVGYYEYCIQDALVTAEDPCTNWIKVYDNTTTIVELIAGTTYYWQVRAEVAGLVGYADDGDYWSFTTAEPTLP